MSTRAAFYRSYLKQKRSAVANAAGNAVLDFGRPPASLEWVVQRVFVRGAAGQTVRVFVGSDPGSPLTADPLDEVDAVTANPAVNTLDEIEVDSLEPIWALVSGLAVGTQVFGNIRGYIRSKEVF